MKINISTGVGGAWIDKKNIKTGDVIKLTTEAQEVDSQQGGKQVVAKALVKGGESEAKNVAINKPSQRALVEAYGYETADWVGRHLTAHVERTMMAGRRGIALYLLPEGFEVTEDEGGYVVVRPVGFSKNIETTSVADMDFSEVNADDIPFLWGHT